MTMRHSPSRWPPPRRHTLAEKPGTTGFGILLPPQWTGIRTSKELGHLRGHLTRCGRPGRASMTSSSAESTQVISLESQSEI